MFEKIDKKLLQSLSNEELLLLKEYRASLQRIRSILADLYGKYGDKVTFAQLQKYNRLASYEAEIIAEIKRISGVSLKQTTKSIKDLFAESYYQAGFVLETTTLLKMGFAELNPDVINAAINNPLDRVKWQFRNKTHHERAIQQIKSELTQGIIQKKGYAGTARDIKNRYDNLANNVVRIVRTEGHRVQVEGRVKGIEKAEAAAKRLNIKIVRVISSVQDSRTRPQSRMMDGQEAGEDGLFTYPNGVRGLPGQTGVPKYDINDRETVVVKLPDYEEQKDRLPLDSALAEYNSYQEWFNGRIK